MQLDALLRARLKRQQWLIQMERRRVHMWQMCCIVILAATLLAYAFTL